MTLTRRRSRLIARLALGALVAVMLMVPNGIGAQTGPVAAYIATPGTDLWTADLRAGISNGLVGYGTFSGRELGSLSSNTFSWLGTTYTVRNVLYNRLFGDVQGWDVLIDITPRLPDGFECLTLRLGDQWLNLADGEGNRRQFFWRGVDLDWLPDARVSLALREFPRGFEARSISGWGNNYRQPELGMADTPLLRRAGVSLDYGMSSRPGTALPEPRVISNLLSDQPGPIPNSAHVTDMLWQWGQFLDHDISFTPEGTLAERMPMRVPRGDPVFDPFSSGGRTMNFTRSLFDRDSGTGPNNPREQVNRITAFIDASNVYGSDISRTRALRTNDGTGRLKTSSDGRLLPLNLDGLDNDDGGTRRGNLFLAGDVRSNEQVGLTALHTLFVREHNRLAGLIAAAHPDLTGQEIFELARKIVGAQMQVITYNEFLPLLLGPEAIGPYEGYDPAVDPSIANEFSTAAYRFGHTMLSPNLMQIDESGEARPISLMRAFFNPAMISEQGISGLLRGLSAQRAQEVDALVIDEIRNLLFGPPGSPGRDLAALNIQRGRDHGIPAYNVVRNAYGLPAAAGFADVSSDPAVQEALRQAYGDIDQLELWTGGLAEDHFPGAMVGETFRAIIAEQFRRLRDGDRYWFERDPYFVVMPVLLEGLRATTLADVIRRNTRVGAELSAAVFGGPQPTISIGAVVSLVGEGAPLTFTLRRSGAAAEELSVDVRISESGAMLRDGTALTQRVTFAPGEDTVALTLATDDDVVAEGRSTVAATLAPIPGYRTAVGGAPATVAVLDDESVEVPLEEGGNYVRWTGADGLSVADALRGAGEDTDITDKVSTVFFWDESTSSWLAFYPSLSHVRSIHTLTTLRTGHTYLILADESVIWTVIEASDSDADPGDDSDTEVTARHVGQDPPRHHWRAPSTSTVTMSMP